MFWKSKAGDDWLKSSDSGRLLNVLQRVLPLVKRNLLLSGATLLTRPSPLAAMLRGGFLIYVLGFHKANSETLYVVKVPINVLA